MSRFQELECRCLCRAIFFSACHREKLLFAKTLRKSPRCGIWEHVGDVTLPESMVAEMPSKETVVELLEDLKQSENTVNSRAVEQFHQCSL